MFDDVRLARLSPVERRLDQLLTAEGVRNRRSAGPSSVRWPALVWPHRVLEASVRMHRPELAGDEEARRRAVQADLLEDGAWALHRARLAERDVRRAVARRARALAHFARLRPAAALDRAPGERGAASAASRAARPPALSEVSEWAADEAAVALGTSPAGAARLLEQCVVLDEQLPGVWAALHAGEIGWAHAVVLVEVLGPMSSAALRREAERRLLARAAGKSPAQLRAAARRVVLRIDAEAAARRAARAVAGRRVRFSPGDDGMAGLDAQLPLPVARACYSALSAYADANRAPGDTRSRDERMADCLADLLLRPGAADRPPVQVSLTVVVPAATLLGGDEPAEVDGEAVPAAVVRELAHALGLLPRPVEEPAPRAEGGAGARTAALGALLSAGGTAGTALEHRPHIAVVDALEGTLLALTDAAGIRRGEALGPPPESPGYRPGRALDRFVRLRDRRCRFPGCRARPRTCDLDHVRPYPLGPTAGCNLCALCEHHHRLKHQALGWALTATGDGGLTWTTPGGLTVTTRPPRYGADDDVPRTGPPTGGRARAGADRGADRVPGILDLLRAAAGRPPGAAPITGTAPPGADDPPPF